MSRDDVFQRLGISPFTLGFGCLHQWHYVVGVATNVTLTISFKPGPKQFGFTKAVLAVSGKLDEEWPQPTPNKPDSVNGATDRRPPAR
jgi:hypothetical protein